MSDQDFWVHSRHADFAPEPYRTQAEAHARLSAIAGMRPGSIAAGDYWVVAPVPPPVDLLGLTRVSVPLVMLETITPEQVARLRILIEGFKPESVSLFMDSWIPGAVSFALLDAKEVPIIGGLIEPDGSAHT